MSAVGQVFTDPSTNKQYECSYVITISPTLITDRERTYSASKLVMGTGSGSSEPPKTIVLEDEDGNRIVAVLVDEEVDFTATANDIREGKVAATDDGVTIGEKFIPSYYTVQGTSAILANRDISVKGLTTHNNYDYTKFQAVISTFNTNISNSVSTEIVSFDNSVYEVRSTDLLSTVTVNYDTKSIDLGITNNFGAPCIIRYITYKEVE